MTINVEEAKKLEKTLSSNVDIVEILQKKYGKGNIMRLNSTSFDKVDVVPTGIATIDDKIFIVGGFPKGRITHIMGTESSCKTTLCLTAAAKAQKSGGQVAIIDLENALSKSWCETLGVDFDKLIVSQPDNAEIALDILHDLVESKQVDLIIVDSIDALVPQSILEGDFTDSNMGVVARLMSQALRKLTTIIRKSNTAVVFISQIRMKIGVVYGSPETFFGGNAIKFFSSIRLDMRVTTKIKDGEEIIGNYVKIKTIKNKLASPFKEFEVAFLYDKGFDAENDLIDTAIEKGIIVKAGSWFSYGDERIGQGRNNVKDWLDKNKELITEKVKNAKGGV